MAYIGKQPIVGNFQKCDAITVVNGQAAYTLQVSSSNVSPESANHMLVSLNGVLQAPITSFSIAGSTLTFVSNLATGDVIDFVILLGNALDLGTPSDGTVTNAKLAQDIISGETALASEPADTDEFLVSDAGTLKRIDYSLIKGGGAWNLLTTNTVSSAAAAMDFTSSIDSTYRTYAIILSDMVPATDDVNLNLQVSQDAGSNWLGSSGYRYRYVTTGRDSDNTVKSLNSDDAESCKLMSETHNTADNAACTIFIDHPSGTDRETLIYGHGCHWTNAPRLCVSNFALVYKGTSGTPTAAITGIRILMSSGNLTGVGKLYGIS